METSDPAPMDSDPTRTLIPRPEAIVVPRRHGEILIEPPATRLAEFLSSAKPHPSGQTIAGISRRTWSELARRELMDAMVQFAGEIGFAPPPGDAADRRWVITGHQVELYHPGVWSKVLLIDALARQSDSLAIDLLVDHDTVDHLGCAVPYWNGPRLEKSTVAWSEASTLPAEFLSAPQGKQKDNWLENIRAFPMAGSDSMRQFTATMADDCDTRYVTWMGRARRRFEQSFGINVQHVPCAYICSGTAWHSLVMAWVRNARHWCLTYNAALEQYRRRQGITNPGHPMPNLAVSNDDIELPFWIYADHQPRHRLTWHEHNGAYLAYGQKHINIADLLTGDLPRSGNLLRERLATADLRVRPRALTLTMFVRLFLSDLFIHGIGGALYDQMTDQIMEQLFGIQSAYACASAGWLLPVAGDIDWRDADVAQLKSLRHHWRGNPELLQSQLSQSEAGRQLFRRRRELIERITASLADDRRHQRRRGPNWQSRRHDFHDLHDINDQLAALFQNDYHELETRIIKAELTRKNLSVASGREYFLALHPRVSLQALIDAIRAMVPISPAAP